MRSARLDGTLSSIYEKGLNRQISNRDKLSRKKVLLQNISKGFKAIAYSLSASYFLLLVFL